MDFYKIEAIRNGHGRIEIGPSLQIVKSKDLMIKGGKFYSFWDETNNIWSTDMYRLYEYIDNDIRKFLDEHQEFKHEKINFMTTYKSAAAKEFEQYIRLLPDNWHSLDDTVTFLSEKITRDNYKSKRLPYDPQKGDISAYNELMDVLYFPEEREKIEWAIGSILCGDSKDIQKFMVLYGNAGTGKSTVMNIIDRMFPGYVTTFDSKALGSGNSSFSLEPFENNPLVGIQHDGDLSRIEDNTKINSVVSHEMININAKFKSIYSMRINCFLFIGTNKPVKITDAKSGIIRRLIDVHPTGETIPQQRYDELYDIIPFEISAIAHHCMEVYSVLGKRYYSGYKPLDMMYKTDPFFNFVDAYYLTFKNQDSTTLKQSYALYKEWVDQGGSEFSMTSYKFREALKDYFNTYQNRAKDAVGNDICDLYKGFKVDMFKDRVRIIERNQVDKIKLSVQPSVLDDILSDCLAQLATRDGKPQTKWENVRTRLRDIDTSLQHYVKPPENLIVIDFDLKDEEGKKSTKLNLEAAAKFPPTYTELSRSGGVHLHYWYDGDIELLGDIYAEHIEIKKFKGGSSLRRKLSKCNNLPVAHIRDGLPLRGEKMVDFKGIQDEKHLRNIICKNLAKQISPNTKPSIDYIYNALEQAYESGMHYDVSDMRQAIVTLAMDSTNQSEACLKLVAKMKFASEEPTEDINWDDIKNLDSKINIEDDLVFYDVEVFPNLFLVNWKKIGEGKKMHRMINPTPQEIEQLIKLPLVGFNCRRYDNHMLYGRLMGYTTEQLYNLSQKIISSGKKGPQNCFFKEAYNISYTDIYDFASKKQSLKKWEIELGIHHEELGLPWDKPVPEELWDKVAHYCDNDVLATEALWFCKEIQGDWAARKILAKLAGMTPNSTTNSLTTRIIFGKDSYDTVQSELVYTDLSKEFPGYTFERGKSFYKGYETGEGGFVYAEPGLHGHCKVFDVASMHPSTIIALNMFGKYTQRFKDILDARIAAKHNDQEALEKLLDGMLLEYVADDNLRKALVQALKIAINSVYGLTCAQFEHIFRDKRNIDNIVAKRGALFMINLKEEVEKQGFRVVHIKTDSIKVENPNEEIEKFIVEYGKQYGYNFEVEDEFDRICLINDAEFIAYDMHENKWYPKGDRFKTPYVLKTVFTKEDLDFSDLCLTCSVTSEIDLDFNESLEDSTAIDKELDDIFKVQRYLGGSIVSAPSKKKIDMYKDITDNDIENLIARQQACHKYQFVGRVGQFVPIKPGYGGGLLVRKNGDKYDAVQGTKGYRWMEAEKVKDTDMINNIDYQYWNDQVSAVLNVMQETMNKNNTSAFYNSIEEFLDVGALPF